MRFFRKSWISSSVIDPGVAMATGGLESFVALGPPVDLSGSADPKDRLYFGVDGASDFEDEVLAPSKVSCTRSNASFSNRPFEGSTSYADLCLSGSAYHPV